MTVSTTSITDGPYNGNGSTTVFDYSFRVDTKNQLTVYETDSDGTVTTLVVDTDYSVQNVGNDNGGTVTRLAGALPSGYKWYIRSNYDATQETDFASQARFFPHTHEGSFDKVTFLIQQLSDKIGRSVRVADSYPGGSLPFLPEPEADTIIGWNDDGTELVNYDYNGTAGQAASAAAASAAAAAVSETNATAAWDSFDDVYLGAKASDPSVDNDGDALVEGQLYYDTTNDILKIYTGVVWVAAAMDATGALTAVNNLSDLTNVAAARTNLGLVIGTNVQAHSAVLDATTASFTTADETKLDYITVTQAVDLDTMESNIATNNAKVTNVDTNISITHGASTVTVESSDGTDGTINAATTSLSGVMLPADKTKLDYLTVTASADIDDLKAHTLVGGNPHGVTAAQTGAVSKTGDTMTGDLTLWSGSNADRNITVDSGSTSNYTSSVSLASQTVDMWTLKKDSNNDFIIYDHQDAGGTDALKIETGGNITTSGLVNGRDIAADGTKLDGLDAAITLQGTWDASAGTFPGGGTAQTGNMWIVDTAGTVDSVTFAVDDRITAITNNASTTTYTGNWYKSDYSSDVTSVDGLTGTVDLSSSYEPKNTNIQTHITSTSNPHSVTLQQATTAGNTTTNAITTGAHTVNGNITVTGTVDGRDVSADGTKLDTIETGAEVNNISDVNATDLTDGGDTNLHQHDTLENAGATKIAATSSGVDVTGGINVTDDVYLHNGADLRLENATAENSVYVYNSGAGAVRTFSLRQTGAGLPYYACGINATNFVSPSGNYYVDIDTTDLNGYTGMRLLSEGATKWQVRNNPADDKFELIRQGTGQAAITADATNGAPVLYYGGSPKLTTTSLGATVSTASGDTYLRINAPDDTATAHLALQQGGVNKWMLYAYANTGRFYLSDIVNNVNNIEILPETPNMYFRTRSDLGYETFSFGDNGVAYATLNLFGGAGTSGGQIYLNSASSYNPIWHLQAFTSTFRIRDGVQGWDFINCIESGEVNLRHSNDIKLTTTSTGVTVNHSDTTYLNVLSTSASKSALLHLGDNNNANWRMGHISDGTFRIGDLDNSWWYLYANDTTGAIDLNYQSALRLRTTSEGVNIYGNSAGDGIVNITSGINAANSEITLRRAGTSNRYNLRHNQSGAFVLENGQFAYTYITANFQGDISLHYQGDTKLATTSSGVAVTGVATSTGSPTADSHLTRKDYVDSTAPYGNMNNYIGTTASHQADIAACFAEHDVCYIPPDMSLTPTGQVVVPANKTLMGGGDTSDYSNAKSKITSSHSGDAIVVSQGSSLIGVSVFKSGAQQPPSSLATWTNSAIGINGTLANQADIIIDKCNFFGFEFAGSFASTTGTNGRIRITRCNLDCINGFYFKYSTDTVYLSQIHMWPFMGYAVDNGSGGDTETARGKFLHLDTRVDWLEVNDCFSHSAVNFLYGDTGNVKINGGGYDFEKYSSNASTTYAIYSVSPANSQDNSIKISDFSINGGYGGVYLNNGNTSGRTGRFTSISNTLFDRQQVHGVYVQQGNLAVSNCQFGTDTVATMTDAVAGNGNPCAVSNCLYSTSISTPFTGTNMNTSNNVGVA